MKLTLAREAPVDGAIVGVVSIDGGPWCYSLERQDVMIATGEYEIAMTVSGRAKAGTLWSPFPPILPELLHVPGRTAIRIHAGNTIEDTEGCIIIGLSRTRQIVHESRKALMELMRMMQGQAHVTIEILDAA